MADILDKIYTWVCPNCGKTYGETNIGQLEAKTQLHKCNNTNNKDQYLGELLNRKEVKS